jgi:hypothetical protein
MAVAEALRHGATFPPLIAADGGGWIIDSHRGHHEINGLRARRNEQRRSIRRLFTADAELGVLLIAVVTQTGVTSARAALSGDIGSQARTTMLPPSIVRIPNRPEFP